MTFLIITLIVAFIGGCVSTFMNDGMLTGLYDIAFRADECMRNDHGIDLFAGVTDIAYSLGVALIILKFLKKGFEIYVLWTDGDPDTDPILLLTNFVKAISTALIFQWIYNLFIDICDELTDMLMASINNASDNAQEWVNGLYSLGLVPAISGLIFIIFYMILLFTIIGRGIEMVILEAGVPLACCGLLDNDKGVWKAYCNQFIKAFITTILQIVLCKIGITLMISSTYRDLNILWGIGCMVTAVSMPRILREFLVPMGGNGQVGNTVFQTVRVTELVRHAFH